MNSSSLFLVCVNSWLPLGPWQWVLQLKYTLYEELLPFICFILNLPPASFVWCSLVSLLKEKREQWFTTYLLHAAPDFVDSLILSLGVPSRGWRFWRVFKCLSLWSFSNFIIEVEVGRANTGTAERYGYLVDLYISSFVQFCVVFFFFFLNMLSILFAFLINLVFLDLFILAPKSLSWQWGNRARAQ